jgi:hypothetical protein
MNAPWKVDVDPHTGEVSIYVVPTPVSGVRNPIRRIAKVYKLADAELIVDLYNENERANA